MQFLWGKLRERLARHIEAAVNGQPRRIVPLGRWVSDDLVLAADGESGGVARRGASILGLPETTYRRRLRRAVEQAEAGLAPRPEGWAEVRDLLAEVVRFPHRRGDDHLEILQQLLLEEVVSRLPDDVQTGSALLGVSRPTFLRRLAVPQPC